MFTCEPDGELAWYGKVGKQFHSSSCRWNRQTVVGRHAMGLGIGSLEATDKYLQLRSQLQLSILSQLLTPVFHQDEGCIFNSLPIPRPTSSISQPAISTSDEFCIEYLSIRTSSIGTSPPNQLGMFLTPRSNSNLKRWLMRLQNRNLLHLNRFILH